ncbi:hypothetical protein NE237_018844 [Protea cynaroides]|uniref:Uncharacterized protein n=1 Tax=Protea cynaroides TaxID=273540 RepID=A0A9Q0KAR7_9MAGN|nr:hypothetical protein NE237_018844 [Protea cynaroides]
MYYRAYNNLELIFWLFFYLIVSWLCGFKFLKSKKWCRRFSYNEIGSNLITYLTGPLQQSTVTAAVNVNTCSGVASMLPLFGAFVADAYLGRYYFLHFTSLCFGIGLDNILYGASFHHSTYLPQQQ